MNRTTIAFLLVVVAVLGYATWRQVRREQHEKREEEVPLFAGVDPATARILRIENLERDLHLAFERDDRGRWQMIEPMRIEADQAVVQHLFEILLDRRGTPVPASEAKPEELHLDPPRAILEIEVPAAGGSRRIRVDVGSVDVDGAHVNVRADGRLLRTWRDVDTMLDRGLEEYMSHEILDLSANEIVEIHRKGSLVRPGETARSDLAFDALVEDGSWRATAPVVAPLDPDAIGVFLQGLTMMHAAGFGDLGKRLLSDLGLDPPEMSIEVSTLAAKRRVLRFGRAGHVFGQWYCTIEGRTVVWTVDADPVDYFDSPVEILLDPNLTRIPVTAMDAVTLTLDGRELRVWHEKSPMPSASVWRVAERPAAEAAFSPALAADRKRIDDLLGRVAGVRIQPFLAGQTLAPAEIRGSILVEAAGEKEGANFGAETGTVEKGRGLRCQRAGDSIAGLVDPTVLDLLRTPLQEIESLLVVDLPEIEQKALEIAGSGVQRRFVRGSKGLWTPPDVPYEARELRDVLDALLILRAKRHQAGGPFPPLEAPIGVKFTDLTGVVTSYSIGLAPGAAGGEEIAVERDGRRSILQDQGLHGRLLGVLGKR